MSDSIPVHWDLPWHIMVDIFGRIPALSLARCSCVATSWREVTKEKSSLKRKIDLERAWLHEPIEPIIQKGQNEFNTYCCLKMKNFIAMGGHHGFKVFDFDREDFIFDCEEIGSVSSLSLMDGMLMTGGTFGGLCGWDISTWKKLFCVSKIDYDIRSIADLGDNVAVGGHIDGDIQIWRKGVWELHRSLQGHKDIVTGLLLQASNLLISGSEDETIQVWNLVNNACLRVIRGHEGGVDSMIVSDGLIFCATCDGNICSWEIESGEYVQTFRGVDMTCVVVKEGRMVTGADDGTIKIWDVTKGECVRSFVCRNDREQEEEKWIEGIWFDDEKLVVVRGNEEIWVWDFSIGL